MCKHVWVRTTSRIARAPGGVVGACLIKERSAHIEHGSFFIPSPVPAREEALTRERIRTYDVEREGDTSPSCVDDARPGRPKVQHMTDGGAEGRKQ
jgi:hypothetical protein